MADVEANILIRAVDKVTAPVRRINAAVDRMTRPIRRVSNAAMRLGEATGINTLARGLRGAAAAAGGLGSRLAGVLGPLGALGGAASVAGLGKIVTDFATGADETSKFARQVGLSAESLQELQYAADRQGVSQQLFNSSMVAFSKRVGELRAGTGGLHTMLQKVNPAFAEQLKNAESTEEAFGMMMTAINKLEDPQKRAALAAAAFSRSGVAMTRMAEAGAEGIAALREDARRLGLVIDNETAAAAEGFVDSMTRWSAVIKGVGNAIGAKLMPQIEPLLQSLTEWVLKNRELIATKISDVVERVADALRSIDWEVVQAGIKGFIARVQSLVEYIGGWDVALIGIIALMNGGLIASILSVAGAFVKLGAVVLANPVLAIIAAIAGAVYAIYANWDGIVAWFDAKLSRVTAAFEDDFLRGVLSLLNEFNPTTLLAEAVNGMVKWLLGVDLFAIGSEWAGKLVDGTLGALRGLGGLGQWAANKLERVALAFSDGLVSGVLSILAEFNPVTLVADAIGAMVRWLLGVDLFAVGSDVIGGFWDGIRGMWGNVTAWLRDAINSLTSFMPDWVKEQLGIEVSAVPMSNAEMLTTAAARGEEAADQVEEPGWLATEEERKAYEIEREKAYKAAHAKAMAEMQAENRRIRDEQAAALSVPEPAGRASGRRTPADYGLKPPPGSTRPTTEGVMQSIRPAAAPASLAAGLAMTPAAAAPSVPSLASDLMPAAYQAAPVYPPDAPSVIVEPRDGPRIMGPGSGPKPAPVYNTPITVSVTVNGQVEADAVQRAVEAAVRRALEDARDAEAVDERASLYD